MKNAILLMSGTLVLAATTTGLTTTLLASDPGTIARMSAVAGILGLGSIGLFFVGLAFPQQQKARVKPMVR